MSRLCRVSADAPATSEDVSEGEGRVGLIVFSAILTIVPLQVRPVFSSAAGEPHCSSRSGWIHRGGDSFFRFLRK